MKRPSPIVFLTTLMVAFMVAFGFVVDSASAQSVTTCQGTIVSTNPSCTQTFNATDRIQYRFDPGINLSIDYQNESFNFPSQLVPRIGAQILPPINLQAGGVGRQEYLTSTGMSSGVFENQTATRETPTKLTISGARNQVTGNFVVPATLEAGITFTNFSLPGTIPLTFTFSPSGQWSPFGVPAALNGPGGLPGNTSARRFQNLPIGSLVVIQGNNAQVLDQSRAYTLQPGQSLNFVMNDQPGIYWDNQGQMQINWTRG